MFLYLYDAADGSTVELANPFQMTPSEYAALAPLFPNAKPCKGYPRHAGNVPGNWRDLRPVSRVVRYKAQPSRHECDARCMHAKGRTMTCECACGGKNHGKFG